MSEPIKSGIICQHCHQVIEFDAISADKDEFGNISQINLIKQDEYVGIITPDGKVCHDVTFWPECKAAIIGLPTLD